MYGNTRNICLLAYLAHYAQVRVSLFKSILGYVEGVWLSEWRKKNKNRKADCRVLGYMKDKKCYLQLVSSKLM